MNVSREKSGTPNNQRVNQNGSKENKSSLHVQRIPSEPTQVEYNLGTSPRLQVGAIDMLSLQANCKKLGIKSLSDNNSVYGSNLVLRLTSASSKMCKYSKFVKNN